MREISFDMNNVQTMFVKMLLREEYERLLELLSVQVEEYKMEQMRVEV